MINEPVPFEGTPEQRAANFQTHLWGTFNGEDYACSGCDAKPWHKAADYPCGTDVPRRWACVDCERGVLHTHTAEEAARLRGEVPA